MGYGLWVMGYGLWVMGYGLWVKITKLYYTFFTKIIDTLIITGLIFLIC